MIFIIAAILTPPDIVSQTLMAIPMMVLYEIGILGARIFVRKKPQNEDLTK
jgi:sec-independent protein translocase protein TatC